MDDRTSGVCDDAQLKDGQVMHKRGFYQNRKIIIALLHCTF